MFYSIISAAAVRFRRVPSAQYFSSEKRIFLSFRKPAIVLYFFISIPTRASLSKDSPQIFWGEKSQDRSGIKAQRDCGRADHLKYFCGQNKKKCIQFLF
jgi:hypothetical protein